METPKERDEYVPMEITNPNANLGAIGRGGGIIVQFEFAIRQENSKTMFQLTCDRRADRHTLL